MRRKSPCSPLAGDDPHLLFNRMGAGPIADPGGVTWRLAMTLFTPSRATLWTSFSLSALVVVFFLVDASVSILAPHLLANVKAEVGFPSNLSPILGSIMLVCALVFAIPRTAAVGAILITAFAGGAICTHFRIGEMGSPPQLIS